jgi:hypothetical protein
MRSPPTSCHTECEVHFFRPLLCSYLSQNTIGATLEFKWLFRKEFVNTSNQHLTKKVNSGLLLLFLLRINNLLDKINKLAQQEYPLANH